MTGRLEGKVAVITGAASGIGAGTARRFVEEGCRCVVADIQDEAGAAMAAELGDAATFVHVDVSREDEVANSVAVALERFGRIDVMMNNAGILGAVGSILDVDGEAWDRSLAVLLSSVFYGIKHAGRAMKDQGSGAIINVASTAGLRAGLGPHVYTAAKHGVVGLTQSVATELGRYGIRVNGIAPGGTVTSLTAYVVSGDATDLDAANATGRSVVATRPARAAARHRQCRAVPGVGRGELGERRRARGGRGQRGDRRPQPPLRGDGLIDRAGGRPHRPVRRRWSVPRAPSSTLSPWTS